MWQRRPDSGTVARLRQRPNSCIPNSGDAPVLPPPNGFNGSDAPALSEAANSEAIRPDAAVSSPDGSVLRDRPPPARHASGCRFPTSPPPSSLFVTIHAAFAVPEERDSGSESEPVRRKSAARSRNRFHKPAAPGEAIAPQHRAHNDLRAPLSCCRTACCTICPSCTFCVLSLLYGTPALPHERPRFFLRPFRNLNPKLNHTTDKHAIRYSFRRYGSIPDMFNQLIIK